MHGNVKHGDYLRTLGGAMTAQCKVLHLLFSQSDYPKIVECHIIQSVCLCFVGVVSHGGFGGCYLKQGGGPPPCCTMCLQADQESTSLE